MHLLHQGGGWNLRYATNLVGFVLLGPSYCLISHLLCTPSDVKHNVILVHVLHKCISLCFSPCPLH